MQRDIEPPIPRWDFPNGPFECLDQYDAGFACCLAHTCCCAGLVHATAVGFVSERLMYETLGVWQMQLVSNALRSNASAPSHHHDHFGRARASHPHVHVWHSSLASGLAAGLQTVVDFKYIQIRRKLAQLLASWDNMQAERYTTLSDYLLQACCPFCLRAQEVDAILRYRHFRTNLEVRYENPLLCECGCGFLERDGRGLEWQRVEYFDLGLEKSANDVPSYPPIMARI